MNKLIKYFYPNNDLSHLDKLKTHFFILQIFIGVPFITIMSVLELISPSENFISSFFSKITYLLFFIFSLIAIKKKGIKIAGNIFSIALVVIILFWMNILNAEINPLFKYVQGFYSVLMFLVLGMLFASRLVVIINSFLILLTTIHIYLYSLKHLPEQKELFTIGFIDHTVVLIAITIIIFFAKKFTDSTIEMLNEKSINIEFKNQELAKSEVEIKSANEELADKNEKLRRSEEKYRLLIENGPSVFWIADRNVKMSYISSNISKVYGYTSEEIYLNGSEVWLNRIHKEDLENVLTNFNLIFTENKRYDVNYRIQAKNSNWIWIHDIGEKYVNEKGEELAYGVFTDITFKKQSEQKIFNAMIATEEKERSRIAKDLHDGVSPVLSAIKLYIQSMNDSSDLNMKSVLSEKINITISEAIESIKEISNNISPHILQNFGLKTAVDSFATKISGTKDLNIVVQSEIIDRFSLEIETAFYRITTELINNTIKYANAKNVVVNYLRNDEEVKMKYSDDGIGFNINEVLKKKFGMGIFNMKNRINSLDGQISIESKQGEGLRVNITVPLNG